MMPGFLGSYLGQLYVRQVLSTLSAILSLTAPGILNLACQGVLILSVGEGLGLYGASLLTRNVSKENVMGDG